MGQLVADPDARGEVMRILGDPVRCIRAREVAVAGVRAAVPDFERRFADGRLHLEETRGEGEAT